MIPDKLINHLKKQKYRFAGNHSLVKICHYTRCSITKNQWCYKHKFYGIKSHQCLQCTTTPFCFNQCIFCWRAQAGEIVEVIPIKKDIESVAISKNKQGKDGNEESIASEEIDEPEEIIESMIEVQRKLLSGIGGHYNANKKLWEEAQSPRHVALSVLGEPITYPKLKELLKGFHRRGMSTFLVTAGSVPLAIKKMIDEKYFPTQLYLSMAAYDNDSFSKIVKPINEDGWERYLDSLKLLKEAGKYTRTVIRMTLMKGTEHTPTNLLHPEKYAELIKLAEPHYVEVKAYMAVGFSRKRIGLSGMPSMDEIREFAKQLSEETGYIVTDEHHDSRVVLLSKDVKAKENRIIDFEKIRE